MVRKIYCDICGETCGEVPEELGAIVFECRQCGNRGSLSSELKDFNYYVNKQKGLYGALKIFPSNCKNLEGGDLYVSTGGGRKMLKTIKECMGERKRTTEVDEDAKVTRIIESKIYLVQSKWNAWGWYFTVVNDLGLLDIIEVDTERCILGKGVEELKGSIITYTEFEGGKHTAIISADD